MGDALKTVDAPWYSSKGGTTAHQRHVAQDFCRKLVEDKKYQEQLRISLVARTCAPAIEMMVWAYAYGRPTEHIDLNKNTNEGDLSAMSLLELQKLAGKVQEELSEAVEIAKKLPANVLNGPWKAEEVKP